MVGVLGIISRAMVKRVSGRQLISSRSSVVSADGQRAIEFVQIAKDQLTRKYKLIITETAVGVFVWYLTSVSWKRSWSDHILRCSSHVSARENRERKEKFSSANFKI